MIQKIKSVGLALLAAIGISAHDPAHKPTVYMIGDSTMANKSLTGGNQERGWGHVLASYFTEDVIVSNHAVNGRSSKSFIDEGRWDAILKTLQEGDYVIIQFGHNDEKANPDRHTDPGTTFDANLKKFVDETRAKGATPILCNSIVRRNFAKVKDAVAQDDNAGQSESEEAEGNELIDTHGDYLKSPRDVAEKEGVIFIDMNKLTHDLVEGMGPVESRKLFVWAEPNTVAAYPKGKKDNTHLNVYGARTIAGLAAKELEAKVPGLAPYIRYYDIVVAKDGSGDYFTIQEAINNVPDYSKNHRTTIMVRGGEYEEKVVIPESKLNVSLIGQSGATIKWNDYASKKNKYGDECSTSGSATFYVYADNFECEGMTFVNTAGRVGQAVAAFVSSNAKFRKCKFIGNQDTLYTYEEGSEQLYDECYIEGTVDFIFGKATAYFNKCEIKSVGKGYVCAPATPQGQKFGYVFNECKLTASEGVEGVALARPWRPYAQAVYINCEMGSHIAKYGWDNWNNGDNEKTAYFGEWGSTGPGAETKGRAKWAHKIEEPAMFDMGKVIK